MSAQHTAMVCPRIYCQLIHISNDTSAQWIQMDAANQLKEIAGLIKEDSLKAVLKHILAQLGPTNSHFVNNPVSPDSQAFA